ncbi:MAG TPA: hypothetical protein PKC76_03885 [Saprospiraceae bacterium]|nr:hypothetical protein [Saprospiraceae bacterium]HMP23243.1 hypothetical protein [Saprospiraceae bacterium]
MDAIIGNQKIENWVVIRILSFLNAATSAREISEKIKDDPNSGAPGPGVGIGEVVAARLLEKRDSLQPFRRFTSINELEGIPGLGPDKIRDLIYTFEERAADAFRRVMYEKRLILDSWKLEHYTSFFDTDEAFRLVTRNDANLSDFVARQVERIAFDKYCDNRGAALAASLVKRSYLERYEVAEFGAYAFTFWWYQIASDNWFSFENLRVVIAEYLNYYAYMNADREQQLLLFKGFPNAPALVEGITQQDLPVVLNPVERAITIWTSELFD